MSLSARPSFPFLREIRNLVSKVGLSAPLFVFLTVITNLIQGIGLILLIPLLQVIGVGGSETEPTRIVQWIESVFSLLGIPVSLFVLLLVFVFLVTGQALLTLWQLRLGAQVVRSYACSRQDHLFDTIASADAVSTLKKRSADLVHLLIQDVNQVAMGLQHALRLVSDLIGSAIFLLISLAISLPLTLIALASGGLLLLILRPLNLMSRKSGARLRKGTEALLARASELLSGLKVVKAFGGERRAIKEFRSRTRNVAEEHVHFITIHRGTALLSQIGGAITLALFVYGAAEWLEMPASEYLVMIVIFSRLLPRISSLQENWQHLLHSQPAMEALNRAQEELSKGRETGSSFDADPLPLEESIVFQDVTFSYDDERQPALEGIHLQIKSRQITAILGHSGAGKTTLADLLIALARPTSGQILLDGRPLQPENIPRWRRSVGYVPQESFLFHKSIRDNLLWANRGATEEEMWEALRLGSADRFVRNLPQGLDTIVGDRGGRMSGGERQRIALARALLIRPSLLLLDEATSEIDRRSQKRILDAVVSLRDRMTIVIIAHHAPVETIADKIILLEEGKVLEKNAT